MRKLSTLAIVSAACACTASAQMGRSLDWPTYGGDAQRTGWEKADSKFKKEEVAKEFQFLWKVKPDGKGPRTLMTPVIIGNLIGYRGFKELAFIAGTDDSLHVMDADLNRTYWKRSFETNGKPKATAGCTGGMTAMPTLMAIGFRRPGPRPAPGAAPARPAPNPMFGPRAIYVISSDGKLHRVNVAHGEDTVPAVPVLPPNAKASTLNMNDNVIYTTTSEGCGGAPNAVWAIDLANPNPQGAPTVKSFVSGGGNFVGLGGPVIGTDGTIYVQAGDGPSDPAANKYSNALLALSPKDLKLKGYFSAPAGGASPVVFAHNGHDLIVTGGKDGRLYLVDAASMGGEDHRTALSQTAPIAGAGGELWGGISTWQEQDGPRWVLATVWGPVKDGAAKHGSIVAFKLEEQGGKPALTPAWTSADLVKPAPPVIANGVVFALSNGDRQNHATLHALDALTGKELWSTGNQVSAAGSLTGLTIANGRVYFATTDNTLWAFGVPLEW